VQWRRELDAFEQSHKVLEIASADDESKAVRVFTVPQCNSFRAGRDFTTLVSVIANSDRFSPMDADSTAPCPCAATPKAQQARSGALLKHRMFSATW
jgi:hypothetical protein